ncbi:hypothetical protein [Cohnella caldifontis]|uniref:hypothetical protein n=1 Tax=Cohnella caldifontis TaxID=3027471 RepID=UPI0023EA7A58|nr:hypothetical protein [Cohnella sp. YIM B05605]
MAVVVCLWCQNEIPQEEGAEPEKYCPICENELDGYRTLTIGLDDPDEEEEAEEEGEVPAGGEEGLSWMEDRDLREKNETLLQFEETVERLMDDQEAAPECPMCREYMLEAGERIVSPESFRPLEHEMLGGPVLKAPFSLTVYVCPSCFNVQHVLSESDRRDMEVRLSRANLRGGGRL